jgi:D-alanyl-D-alanine carboxypeptidase
MSRPVAYQVSSAGRLPLGARVAACLTLLCLLAACGSQPAHRTTAHYAPSRYYPPPGPPNDPWGPYIREASGRFGVPELWIRRVMHQESGGQEDVISWAGAMGLMQVMPDTYSGLRDRYQLGGDPFDPHNNILAGTAYLREMYDRFGAPGFLAAYNAGPNRVDSYLNYGTPLPAETVNYVASIAPLLGPGTPMSGPLAVYAGTGRAAPLFASRGSPNGCDPDAAYNPNGPCTPLRQPSFQPVAVAAAAPVYVPGFCDPDAAYDPNRPCRPAPQTAPVMSEAAVPVYASGYCDPDAAYDPVRRCRPAPQTAPVVTEAVAPAYATGFCDPDAAFDPSRPCRPAPSPPAAAPVVAEPLPPPAAWRGATFASSVRSVAASPRPVAFDTGHWAIQVGAFANLATAEAAADSARKAVPDVLRTARTELPPTTPFGGKVAYRARLAGLTPEAATDACARLSGRGLACMTVPPARDSF